MNLPLGLEPASHALGGHLLVLALDGRFVVGAVFGQGTETLMSVTGGGGGS